MAAMPDPLAPLLASMPVLSQLAGWPRGKPLPRLLLALKAGLPPKPWPLKVFVKPPLQVPVPRNLNARGPVEVGKYSVF